MSRKTLGRYDAILEILTTADKHCYLNVEPTTLEKRAEETYSEYRRQKDNGSGEGGMRLPL